jgi:hypothetical protein
MDIENYSNDSQDRKRAKKNKKKSKKNRKIIDSDEEDVDFRQPVP